MKKRKPAARITRARSKRQEGRSTVVPAQATTAVGIDSIDWSAVIRAANREHLAVLAGARNLPSVVVWEFEPGRFRGVDGFHRWILAKTRGERTIPAVVRHYSSGSAGQRAYEFECLELNIQHGLPLTRVERDRAIRRLWARWGRSEERPQGVTLDELGRTFNLTKQRVHQIVSSSSAPSITAVTGPEKGTSTLSRSVFGTARMAVGADEVHGSPDTGRNSSGFSPLGRFTAAARRLSTVLSDTRFVTNLISTHRSEVRQSLEELRDLLIRVLRPIDDEDTDLALIHHAELPSSLGRQATRI